MDTEAISSNPFKLFGSYLDMLRKPMTDNII